MSRFNFTFIFILVAWSLIHSQTDSINLNLAMNTENSIIGNQQEKTNISIESQNAKAIHMLGTWHRTFGSITIGYSALTILGALYYTIASNQPLEGIVYVVIGSINLSIGLWEFNIGSNLKKYQ
jgi:hypothetical protein